MFRLWTPWRLKYVTGATREAACVFCDAQQRPDEDALVVWRGSACFVILNLYPYNSGHLMVVPMRHVASLGALTRDERVEVIELTRIAEAALTDCYAPHGVNVGINLGKAAGAGVLDHLHVHLVPRWHGDTNFMSVVGETRVLPEELPVTAARLRPLFARHAAAPAP